MAISRVDRDVTSDERILVRNLDAALTGEPDASATGLFLKTTAKTSASRLLVSAGQVPDLVRYTVCHRYEPYWMKPAAGNRLSEVPAETQFLLAELTGGHWLLMVPLIDDECRSSLRGHSENRLELVIETGDPHRGTHGGLSLYVASGPEPFELLRRSAVAVADRLGAVMRASKPVPAFADHFGWCTWDAFYQEVSADKVREGLARFSAGGVRPRFLILDDGWQSVRRLSTGEQRLTSLDANEKFGGDLSGLIADARKSYGVETFLVWHAMIGYWGGVDPLALPKYGVVEQARRFGEGIMSHRPRFNEDWWGGLVGLVPESAIESFYDDYHRRLAEQGVDGVKVDNQAVLEALASGQGGRVRLTRAYRKALEGSVERHFDGRLINCMANAQETYYGSPLSTLTRTSIDFFPNRPESHSAHVYANAQVGLWFGHFMTPDWDMFQSGHPWGAFHAAARALSGGPVYVSDVPGKHDVDLLRKLVCSDGSVLRADGPGLPTLDSLCVDPTREQALLKIHNLNGHAGFLGAFHARYDSQSGVAEPVTGVVRASDVVGLSAARYACYRHVAGRLEVVDLSQESEVTLGERQFELFTFAPIQQGFAAIGLVDKFNSAGALCKAPLSDGACCRVSLKDGGVFLAWSERAPQRVEVDGRQTPFDHDSSTGAVSVALRGPAEMTLYC